MNQAAIMDENQVSDTVKITRALISVSDKSGIVELAKLLTSMDVEILSTGGTAKHLQQAGIAVTDVSSYTGFPEMMDGRVKTLHPKIFGGVLFRRDHSADRQSIDEHEILPIDLLVVNLYPFGEVTSKPDCDRDHAIENIDIGGPSLVRAAAKNCRYVTIATEPSHYDSIAQQLRDLGGTSQALRNQLMAAAFQHTASYDRMIADYFAGDGGSRSASENQMPEQVTLKLTKTADLRYGENSHQQASHYRLENEIGIGLNQLKQRHGKELSFNNLLDLNAGLTMVSSFDEAACVVIKHSNPCGAASGQNLADVFARAFAGDPQSAFGSIVATNRTVDVATAEFLATEDLFVEALLAPAFDSAALEILKTKPKWKMNVRLVECPMLTAANPTDIRRVHGGLLIQQSDHLRVDQEGWKSICDNEIPAELINELQFAWNMVRFVKSNAIVLGQQQALVGVGAGQMSRVDAVRIAIEKAGDRAAGSVLASDAFFPFADSIEVAVAAGIAAVIQPGGSRRDDEVIAACQQHQLPLIMTGQRHFLH